MKYTFESFDTEIVGGKLRLPRNLLKNEDGGPIVVFPTPYMTLRISDEKHFDEMTDSTKRLPANHRRMVLRLMYSKSILATSTSGAADAAVHIMRSIYKDKANFSDKKTPIPVRVENCGEYVQITVIG